MMCYKDMTFCNEIDCFKFNTCPRAYNDEAKAGAFKWMGENAPVALWVDRPECYKEIEEM